MEDWKKYINRVNCMDAMDLLKMMPDKSIDLVLTDPPYGIGAGKEKPHNGWKNYWNNYVKK